MNFQDALKEISEQIKIHLKDKRIEAISSLLTDVIDASFAVNVIQTAIGSCTRPFSPHPIHGKKRSGHARLMQDMSQAALHCNSGYKPVTKYKLVRRVQMRMKPCGSLAMLSETSVMHRCDALSL